MYTFFITTKGHLINQISITSLFLLLIMSPIGVKAQVTIGSGLPPERGALLDLKQKKADIETGNLETAITGGLLMPRVHLLDSMSLAPIIDSSFILNNAAEYTKIKQLHTGLLVYNLTTSSTRHLSEGLYKWDGNVWNRTVDTKLLTETVEDLKSVLPLPAVFMLNSNKSNFLATTMLGGKQSIDMIQLTNTAPDYIQLSTDGTKITFAPGFYIIQFVYEAEHNVNCTLSSYFVDFPNDNYPSSSLRIHSNSSHDTYSFSNHGGIITAPCLLTQTIQWDIALGRGQAGNCSGNGMILIGKSTFLYIIRYTN